MATIAPAVYEDESLRPTDIRLYLWLDDTYPAPGLPAMPPVTTEMVQAAKKAIHAFETPINNGFDRLIIAGHINPA